MSAVPAEVVLAKTVEQPLVVHVVFMPASGPQNNVLLLPKELVEKVTKMHFSALGAEPVVLSGEVGPTGTSPKVDCGGNCERFCGDAKSVAFDSGSTGKYRKLWRSAGPVHRFVPKSSGKMWHLWFNATKSNNPDSTQWRFWRLSIWMVWSM